MNTSKKLQAFRSGEKAGHNPFVIVTKNTQEHNEQN